MPAIVGYYPVRSLAEPIRLLLHHVNADYVDKLYKLGPPPNVKEEWFSEKFKLGLDFPNVPYYIDGDIKLTQSMAILRYLARKYALNGQTEEEQMRLDIAEQACYETLMQCFRVWYMQSDFENAEKDLIEALKLKLDQFDKFLGNRDYLIGDRISYADFLLFSTLDYVKAFKPELVAAHDNLTRFLARIEGMATVERYFKSDLVKFPINGTIARFNKQRS